MRRSHVPRDQAPCLLVGTFVFGGAAIAGIITSLATINPSPPVLKSAPLPTDPKPTNPSADDPDAEYRKKLTPEQFHVTRERGTEAPFTGKYWNHKGHGLYKCVCCGTCLFDSRTKFDSGTGWPSFYEPIDESRIDSRVDGTLLDQREEVICRKCQRALWAMSSLTARGQPACDIASTPPRSSSRKPWPQRRKTVDGQSPSGMAILRTIPGPTPEP